ncbi:TolC family protein [Deminuibacter soli]|uniref:TolC family protein n=1 Tax=Deminuibacter soli TaxID=2291815 RepID=A0A3E1ND75_9BACT|nr:TolC family protein [Deminuibacter soli]RFM25949.1 TolC family protein [Deminuibacter soli]
MIHRSTTLLLCMVTLIACTAAAQTRDTAATVHAFSVQQCVEYAHKNNNQVKNALLDLQVQQQTNRGITSAALPQINATAGLTDYLKIPVTLVPAEFFGGAAGTYAPVQFGTKYNASAGINLQQVLFDGQVFVGLQARQTSIDYYQKNIEITEENIKANIYKVYYQLVVSKTQVDQIDANIERLEKLLHDTKAMHDNGFAESLDVDKTSVQLANLQTERLKTVNTINNGYLGLKILIGMPVKEELTLTDNITDEDIKQNALDSAYQYENRKEYQALMLSKKLNEYNVKRYKLSYFPSLSLNGAYSKAAYRTEFDVFNKGDWFTTSYIGLNVSIPIFDGLQKDANIKKARLQTRQVENQLEDLKLSIDNDATKARNDFKSAIATIDYQKRNMTLAANVYNQTKKKYELGLASSTDLTNAQTDLRTSESNYISALYDGIIARVNYLKATGQLK